MILLIIVYVVLSAICFWLNETNNCDNSICFDVCNYYDEDKHKLYYILFLIKAVIVCCIIAKIILNYDYMY